MVKQVPISQNNSELFKYNFYNYLGAFIGILSNLFLYTTNQEFLGILRYTESLAFLIFPIILMGSSSSLINFSPNFRQENKKNLFSYGLKTIIRNSVFVFSITYLSLDIFSLFIRTDFIYFAFIFAVFLAFIELLKKQLTLHNIISFPSVLDNLMPKIILPFIFILFLFKQIDNVIIGLYIYVFSFFVLLILLYLYGARFNAFSFTLKTKGLFDILPKKEYLKYSFFALAGSLGYLFVFKLDSLMIPNLISFKANGLYSIATVAASVIYIPARGMFSLYAPRVSKLVKNEQFSDLSILYKDVSKSLLFIGLLLYGSIFIGIESLFYLMPSKEVLLQTVSVIYIIGITSVFNMATGFNSEIIIYSKYYNFNLIALGVLTLINLVSNYLFIITFGWGIEGAALASFLSIFIFNSIKVVFIYIRFDLLPFSKQFFKLLLIQTSLILFFNVLPSFSNSILNLCFKVGGLLIVQLFLVYKLKIVDRFTLIVNRCFKI